MSLYTAKFCYDPYFEHNIKDTLHIFGGFIIKIVYSQFGQNMSRDQFLSLFYTDIEATYPSNFKITKYDSLLQAYYVTEETDTDITYKLRFYVPLQFTTDSPFSFCICYYDSLSTTEGSELSKIKPFLLSNRNLAENTNQLPYNQGRFNVGWNSIEFTLNKSDCKTIFGPINNFNIFDINSFNLPAIVEAETLFEGIVKNEQIRSDNNDNTASRQYVNQVINKFENYNIKNTFRLIGGSIDEMVLEDILEPKGELVCTFRHSFEVVN